MSNPARCNRSVGWQNKSVVCPRDLLEKITSPFFHDYFEQLESSTTISVSILDTEFRVGMIQK